jgi:hypothetical protein
LLELLDARFNGFPADRAAWTPPTYEVGGRQFLVVYATGGKGKSSDPTGGVYVAFALLARTC